MILLACVALWFSYEKLLIWISGPKFPKKWNTNLLSATHSVLSWLECYAVLNGWGSLNEIYHFSVSYFLYDLKNHKLNTIYVPHHILSIIALIYGTHPGVDKPWILWGYLLTEFGNFPLYVMYAMINHYNQTYHQRWYKHVLIWEFIWFVVFRIIAVSYVLTYTQLPYTHLIGFVLQLANIKWSLGLYKKIKTEVGFFKKVK